MPVSHTITDAPAQGPEPFDLLRRLELLRSLDDTTLEAVLEGVESVRLQEGQALVRQGELDDAQACHLLVDGDVINNLPGDVMRQRGGGVRHRRQRQLGR